VKLYNCGRWAKLDENAGFQSLINNALFFHNCDI
jgi:hypothetical protein